MSRSASTFENLANLGIGHGAVYAGFGYTYFDTVNGHEFSAVIGATYNLVNLQHAVSRTASTRISIWARRNSCRRAFRSAQSAMSMTRSPAITGSGAKLGPFESRVIGVGPQVGVKFRLLDQGYAEPEGLRRVRRSPTGRRVGTHG